MKSKSLIATSIILSLSLSVFAQKKPAPAVKPAPTPTVASTPTVSPTLMTIGGEKVTVEEFLNVYKKNNNRDGSTIDKKSMEEYLDLYTVFRLKVKEAKDMGIDTSKAFRDELSGYRKTLAQPYLTEKDAIDQMVKEAYDRMHWDIRTSHILVKVEVDPAPEDTLEAYNRICFIRDYLNGKATPAGLKKCEALVMANHKGKTHADTLAINAKMNPLRDLMKLKVKDFATVAKTASEHGSKANGGDVGYLSGLTGGYPYEYESAAFKGEKGKLVGPVRTALGYHLLMVTDKRPHSEIHLAHLMLQFKKGMTHDDSVKLKAKVDSISGLIKNGANYEELAKKISDHKESGKKGGDIGWLSISANFPVEFKDAAFALKDNNQVSNPVQTKFGWHIIKRLGTRDLPAFDSLKVELKSKVQQDARSQVAKERMIAKIKAQYGFKETKNVSDFYAVVDSTISMGLWNVDRAKALTKPMFTLGDKTYTQQDFATYIDKNYRVIGRISPRRIVDALYKRFVDESAINYKETRLEKEFPEFRVLMDEYRDGILLFNLTDQKVWTKAIKDTTGAKEYHAKFKDHFLWEDRLDASIFTVKDEKTAAKIRKMISQGKTEKEILATFNKDTTINVTVESKLYMKGENQMLDAKGWNPGVTANEAIKGKIVFANIKKVMKQVPKTYAESRGLVTSEYQTWLEKEWIDSLKKKYPVSVDRSVFDSIK